MAAKLKIAGLVMALMALSVPMLYADNDKGDPKSTHQDGDCHHCQQEHMMAQVLNLTDDQAKQLKDNKQKEKELMKNIFEQIKSNREAFNVEIVKATSDMNKVNDLQNKLKTIQAQMVDNRLNSILDIKKILTPEQYAGYMALKREKELMMHMGHDKFGHKDGFGKDREVHKHWGDKPDEDNDPDSKE
ncbi:MAG: Spy/CpxP family protein refolding chaperone [Candidatus Omnitrophica bacterium]|nr:Spy/CpxP family protein refolding chaperone [Candidatus Omnitrophota bacterium]